MSRLFTSTRGIASWRERLTNPARQWRRGYSAFETAVSWEHACRSTGGIPTPIRLLLEQSGIGPVRLLLAAAEHTVPLPGGRAASQSDVWGLLSTSCGMLSLTVEAKASECFGEHYLGAWLESGRSERSRSNRATRWAYIREHLPALNEPEKLRYQLLHRCASAVIEAKRLGLSQAAFIVQAFNAPESSFEDYALMCRSLDIRDSRGLLVSTSVDAVKLHVGWADCPLATDAEVAATVD